MKLSLMPFKAEMLKTGKRGYLKTEYLVQTRELVAMFMESPFYFDLHIRERLALVHRHRRRFSGNAKAGELADELGLDLTIKTNREQPVTIIVGFIPPQNPSADS